MGGGFGIPRAREALEGEGEGGTGDPGGWSRGRGGSGEDGLSTKP
jgi:hypothetical protein